MSEVVDSPFAVFGMFLVAQWTAAYLGDFARGLRRPAGKDEHEDFDLVQTAILTLLALTVGFSFSMAVSRYDLRKNYEEAEANAIGNRICARRSLASRGRSQSTRSDPAMARPAHAFYQHNEERQIGRVDAESEKLQAELWSAILPAATAQPTAVTALAVAGMNDMLNAQSRTQGAWWNRIPLAAWGLIGFVAIACNWLLGY